MNARRSNNLLLASTAVKNATRKSYPKSWSSLRWSLFVLYCYASFAPAGPVWGLHFLAYQPIPIRIVILSLIAILLLPRVQRWLGQTLSEYYSRHKAADVHWVLTAIVATLGFFVFQMFPSQSVGNHEALIAIRSPYMSWLMSLLSPNILESSQTLSAGLYNVLGDLVGGRVENIRGSLSAISGALFIYLWLIYVQKVASGLLRIVLGSLGLFTGAVQVFFGGFDHYSFAVFASTAFLFCLYFYLYDRLSNTAFILSYVLALKAHPIALLFFPAVILGLMYRYRERVGWFETTFTWRTAIVRIVLPFLGLGIVLSTLPIGHEFQRVFMPDAPTAGAFRQYSLLSSVAVANFVNVLFLIAGPIIVLLLTLLIFNRREVVWSCPIVIVFGVAAFFPFIFFVALNPTLSPVQDWDVYALLFPPLLFFVSVIMTHSTVRDYVPSWVVSSFVFGIVFTTAMVSANASPRAMHKRLEDVDSYAFSGGGYRATEMAQIAIEYAKHGKYAEAIRWGEGATNLEPANTRDAENLAVYYLEAGQLKNASNSIESLYRKAVVHDTINLNLPILANAIERISNYYRRSGHRALALIWAKQAVEIAPHSIEYLSNLASCYMAEKRPREALMALQVIPRDSISKDLAIDAAAAEYSVYGADSTVSYLQIAKAMSPSDLTIDSALAVLNSTLHSR